MSTDFSYNNSTISTTGGFRPNAKNIPLDSRTIVNSKVDISSIPVPFIGMEITVLQDETKGNKMTVYKVTALNERNAIDINTGIEEVTVPKNISDLNNDVNFVTESELSSQIEGNTITPDKTTFFKKGKNLFNKDTAQVGYYVTTGSGSVKPNKNYSLSGFIPVKPNTKYTRNYVGQTAFYNANREYVSGDGTNPTFTTPDSASFVRVSMPNEKVSTYQIEEGTQTTTYEPYGYKVDSSYLPQTENQNKNIYTIREAMARWLSGEKFPVAFFGDSTTDGVKCTGWVGNVIGTDYTFNKAYPYLLEQKLKTLTGNQNLRIYNAGFQEKICHGELITSRIFSLIILIIQMLR